MLPRVLSLLVLVPLCGLMGAFLYFVALEEPRPWFPFKASSEPVGLGARRQVLLPLVAGFEADHVAVLTVGNATDLTLSLWLYLVEPPVRDYRFILLYDGQWGLLARERQLKLIWEPNMYVEIDVPVALTRSWHHVALKRTEGGRRLLVFVDGAQVFYVHPFEPPAQDTGRLMLGCPPAYRWLGSYALLSQVTVAPAAPDDHGAVRMGSPPAWPVAGERLKPAGARVLAVEREVEEAPTAPCTSRLMCAFRYAYAEQEERVAGELALCLAGGHSSAEELLLCRMAAGQMALYGLWQARRHAEWAHSLLEEAANVAFRAWQGEGGIKAVERRSLEQERERLATDGLAATEEEDAMLEIEHFKASAQDVTTSNEWLGDVYYHGKRTVQRDFARAAHHYRLANTTHSRLQLARMHWAGHVLLPGGNASFRALLEEAVAHENSADAANLLGCVAPTEAEATHLFERATRMEPPNLPVANTNAGIMRVLAADARLLNTTKSKAYLLQAASQQDVPGYYWLAKKFPPSSHSAALYFQQAVRYHILEHYSRLGLQHFLRGRNVTLVERWSFFKGFLGLAEAFLDVSYLRHHGDARVLEVALAAHYSLSNEPRHRLMDLLARLQPDERHSRFRQLALASARANSSEGLYHWARHLHASGQTKLARQAYRSLFEQSEHWAHALVAFASYLNTFFI